MCGVLILPKVRYDADMTFDILTLFPKAFESYFGSSMLKRAQKRGVTIRVHNIRDYTTDKRHITDDRPYGGGAGMVLKVEPLFRAISTLKKSKILNPKSETNSKSKKIKSKTFLMSPRGKQFDQRMAEKFSKLDHLILICGHYEGVDERVQKFIDGEIAMGPYVLTGGELPAMTIVDAVARLVPGVLGNKESLREETFVITKALKHKSTKAQTKREYPHYTRPETFEPTRGTTWRVPKVLLTGNHKKINEWRKKHSK